MKEIDSKHFHKLFGVKRPRISYQKKDFLDYTLMTLVSAFVIYFSYGPNYLMSAVGIVLCVFMIIVFSIRHGLELRTPLILKRPQDLLYMIVYKIQNMKLMYIFAIVRPALATLVFHYTSHLWKLRLNQSFLNYLTWRKT